MIEAIIPFIQVLIIIGLICYIEKLKKSKNEMCSHTGDDICNEGYACDDWEKWTEKCQEDFISVSSLPSCKEIEEIMTDHYWDSLEGERGILERHCKFLAKAICQKQDELTKE